MIEYMTAEDVGRALKVSPKSVYRWAAADPSLPQIRIAGTVRFPRERLERWLRAREGQRETREPVSGASERRASISLVSS